MRTPHKVRVALCPLYYYLYINSCFLFLLGLYIYSVATSLTSSTEALLVPLPLTQPLAYNCTCSTALLVLLSYLFHRQASMSSLTYTFARVFAGPLVFALSPQRSWRV